MSMVIVKLSGGQTLLGTVTRYGLLGSTRGHSEMPGHIEKF